MKQKDQIGLNKAKIKIRAQHFERLCFLGDMRQNTGKFQKGVK